MHDPKKIRSRFAVEQEDGWTLADYATGVCVSFGSKRQAERAATFARAYSMSEPWGGTVDGNPDPMG